MITARPYPDSSLPFSAASAGVTQRNSCFSRLGAALVLLLFLLCVPVFGQEIGRVITYTPGASVLRDGKVEPLALRAEIHVSDTIQTDASGRVKILFNDDSAVSVGPNTSMEMREFADSGAKPVFGAHVSQGLIRAITGKIVDQNPGGFKITTTEAVVGIRGTIISLRASDGATTVFVENTLRQVYVNNVNVPSGEKAIIADGVMRVEKIAPQDRRELGRDLAFRGGSGSAAAAPEPGMDSQQVASTELIGDTVASIDSMNTELQDIALSTQILGDSLEMPQMQMQPSEPLAYVDGGNSSPVWSFSFNVGLNSGVISNGTININDITLGSGSFSNGTGFANAGGFSMNADGTWMADPNANASVQNSNTIDLLSVPTGTSFPVDCTVSHSQGSTTIPGIGTITKP